MSTMPKMPASIFNDVIGPVMRGPSSSHVAGAARIAKIVRQSLRATVTKVIVDFDINGSLAESHKGHGTDMGFAAGIMGIDIAAREALDAERLAYESGLEILFNICDYGAKHPNNYRITAFGQNGESHTWEAVSVGGGMIEMWQYDGFNISISGGYHELLVTMRLPIETASYAVRCIEELFPYHASSSLTCIPGQTTLLSLQLETPPLPCSLDHIRDLPFVTNVVTLEPILPTASHASCRVPFSNATELLTTANSFGREMWQFATQYESERGYESEKQVFERMRTLYRIMRDAVDLGLTGTSYRDRILGAQAHLIGSASANGRLLPCAILNNVIQQVAAIMEVKSSMGVVVAAPTAGSCGCLPGTILGVGDALGMGEEKKIEGLLAAGLIGVFIAESATFAAEVAGCQVECGAGSGMAAAGVTQMLGGTVRQCLEAASIALQNITGLACDPVANRVEVPCLGKNIMGASNALVAANMALAGFDAVIPLDQTISALYDIGTKLPLELRCTFGGLGKTEASLAIRKKLEEQSTTDG